MRYIFQTYLFYYGYSATLLYYTKDVVAGDPVDIANNPKKYGFAPSRRASYQW